MRFAGLSCGVAGGLFAFLLGIYDASLSGFSNASLWLVGAGVLGIFGGGIVEDSPIPAAALMGLAAAMTAISVSGIGSEVLIAAALLALGVLFAWGDDRRTARPQRDTRVLPRVSSASADEALPGQFGDSAQMFARLDNLMQLADTSREQRAPDERTHLRRRFKLS